ncbi:patatin-like phospholipase family protein [Fonticella tunisiensis]|uniref:NTE family protein n=1 Tax=Fonticella tunisiensis TaxID=1096341 RepID=A0A4R7KSK6_9CLOT|nr:patatin-like phospholipase family protein [Fonticella tunisiensis]TDT58399.1 NTE family protein [Fonticella tunisiensis]
MKEYGLVLAGGGAKGGYEIGVWKALRELNISIKAVAGTSVGALNGAIIAQDDFDTAYKLWTSISIENVIKLEKEVAVVNENRKKSMGLLTAIKNAITAGGLDITPLKEMLLEIIDEDRIRNSPVDLGIVTFSLSDFKPLKLFKKDIPEGKLVDYLLASACFPAFKPHEIDNKRFIDGGVYDNVPISLMLEKGIKDIISVDISGPGISRKVDKKGLNLIEIKASEDLGGTLDFNGERSKANIELGYYDTLKAFGKLKGSRYFIFPNEDFNEAKELYIKNLGIEDFKKMFAFLGMDLGGKSSVNNKFILDRIMRTIRQYADNRLTGDTVFPAMAEITAEQLGIERKRVYTLSELIDEIMKEYENIKNSRDFKEYMQGLTRLMISRNQLEFDRELKKTLIEGKFIISYEPYLNETDEKLKRFRRFIAVAFPKISIANMFLSLVLSKKN